MQQEKLFFWPLCMTSYAPGEGNGWQFPFPAYENGDLFLSWGSIAVKAYAEYDPAIAMKYVKNVLEQYSKDGLAFQRYGRVKQDGQGDDILSGNSLTIVGLYQAIYGINPLYNRFYLDPHITPELSGTVLNYNFRGRKLLVRLDNDSYSVSDRTFSVTASTSFGFNSTKAQLSYYNGNSANVSLQATSAQSLGITIKHWDNDTMDWEQNAAKPVVYILHQLKSNSVYKCAINGKVKVISSNASGEITINCNTKATLETISISQAH